jgi:hypothetical protein
MQIRCALIQPKILVFPIPLFRVVGLNGSVSRIAERRIEGMRQMGECLHTLSLDYPSYSGTLQSKSKKYFLSYASSKILSGKNTEGRDFLLKKYPYRRDIRWWKMWAGSWLPVGVLRFMMDSKETDRR